MRCRQCAYPLWNLTEPRCPECGTGFDLRTYRFRPGAVAFGCPHCGALHGGAGPNYLPAETDTATCQACAQPMSVPHMKVVPLTEDAEAADTGDIPWEHRSELGWFKAWYRTCFKSMTEPGDLGRALGPHSGFWDAYWFAALTGLAGALVNAVVALTCLGVLFAMASAAGAGAPPQVSPSEMLLQLAVQLLAIPLSFVTPFLMVGIVGGIAHLILMITGERRAGFETTALAVLYGSGPWILAVIPVCGGYVGYVWGLVATILVLAASQRVSGLRASLAVVTLPVGLILMLLVAVAALVAAIV